MGNLFVEFCALVTHTLTCTIWRERKNSQSPITAE
jgi:hypothetical protein